MTRFIDTRPRSGASVFSAEPVNPEFVRLRDVDSGRTHLEDSSVFRRNYESIDWNR